MYQISIMNVLYQGKSKSWEHFWIQEHDTDFCNFRGLKTLILCKNCWNPSPWIFITYFLAESLSRPILRLMAQPKPAVLWFICSCLELRMVIGIILSPALESVSRGFSEAVEDVMMVFSSIMAAWQHLFFTQGCSYTANKIVITDCSVTFLTVIWHFLSSWTKLHIKLLNFFCFGDTVF